MIKTVINTIREAAGVPVTHAPQRIGSDAVVYRYYPGGGDSQLVSGRLELRFTSFRLADAVRRMKDVENALLGEDGSAVVGEGAGRIIICPVAAGGGSGYAAGSGLYYVKTSYDIQGRRDIYGRSDT